jgi:choline dehydrogenase-like flavoprotein
MSVEHGKIVSACDLDDGAELRAQVVVVGLGAGGSMVLHDLAKAGVDVLGVEVGSAFDLGEMTGREEEMLPQLFAEAGARATDDFSVTVLQGRGVGGSTLHNTNLCKRLPEGIRADWETRFGLDFGESLDRDFASIEALLNVHRVPDDRINRNNAAMARGIDALGYAGARLAHNRGELCQQSGFCELGCPNDGKENAARVLIPPALAAGARIVSEGRVERVRTLGGRAEGVEVVAVDPQTRRDGPRIRIHADHVVLAASATASPAVLQRSGLVDPEGHAGRHLHMHPGAVVMGLFDEPIEGWLGVPQAVECTEFLEFGPGARHRVWLVTGFAHPGGAAGFIPGFGPEHAATMRRYGYAASIILMLHDEVGGHVRSGPGEHIDIAYALDRAEWEQVALGMREAGKILLAAGARKVMLPTARARWVEREAELEHLSANALGPLSPPMTAVHPMSTLRMATDPSLGACDPQGRFYGCERVWVADGSLFPTSIGGPPQISIYTFGRRVARGLQQVL